MKRLTGLLMLVVCLTGLPALASEEGVLLQSLESQAQALVAGNTRADGPAYAFGLVYATELGLAGAWTALGIYNYAASSGQFMVGCFDPDGKAVAAGTFNLAGGALKFGLLQGLMTTGAVPALGSIAIFGTKDFKAEKYVGLGVGPDATGAFGVVAKDAVAY
jgi:hypothetical protein